MFLKLTTQFSMFRPHLPWPCLLDFVELCTALVMGTAMLVDLCTSSRAFFLRTSFLFEHWGYNVAFLLWLLLLGIVREAARLRWKANEGYWIETYQGRAFVLCLLATCDFLFQYLFLLPSISSINFRLCDCNNTRKGCTIWNPQVCPCALPCS